MERKTSGLLPPLLLLLTCMLRPAWASECPNCTCSSPDSRSSFCEMQRRLEAVIKTVEKRTPLVMKVRRLEEKVEEQRKTIQALRRAVGNPQAASSHDERLHALENAVRKLREDLASERELGRNLQARLTDVANVQEDKLWEVEDRLESLQEETKANAEAAGDFRELLYGLDGVVYRNETRVLDSRLGRVESRLSEELKSSLASILDKEIRDLADAQSSFDATVRRELADLRDSQVRIQESLEEIRDQIKVDGSSRGPDFLLQRKMEKMEKDLEDLGVMQGDLGAKMDALDDRLADAPLDRLREDVRQNAEALDRIRSLMEGVMYKNETLEMDLWLEKWKLSDELSSSSIRDLADAQSRLNATLRRRLEDLESRNARLEEKAREAAVTQGHIATLQDINLRVQASLGDIRNKIRDIEKSEGRNLPLQNKIEKMDEDMEKLSKTQGELETSVASLGNRLAATGDQLLKDVRRNLEAVDRLGVLLAGVVYKNETRALESSLETLRRELRTELDSSLEGVRRQIQIAAESGRRENVTVLAKWAAAESRLRLLERKMRAVDGLDSEVASLRNSSLVLERGLERIRDCCEQNQNSRDHYRLLRAEAEGLRNNLEDLKTAQLSTTDLLLKANDQLEDLSDLGENLVALDGRVARLGSRLESEVEKTLASCEDSRRELAARVDGVAYKNDTRFLEVSLERMGREIRKELESGLRSARGREIQALAETQRIQNATIAQELDAAERRLRLLEGEMRAADDELRSDVATLRNSSLHLENALGGVRLCCEQSRNSRARYALLQEKMEVMENDVEDIKASQVEANDRLLKVNDQLEDVPALRGSLEVLDRRVAHFRKQLESDMERTLATCEDNLQELAIRVDALDYKSNTSKLEKRLEKMEKELRTGMRPATRDLDLEIAGVAESQNALNVTLLRKISTVESRLGALDSRLGDMEEDFLVLFNTSLGHGKQLEDVRRTCDCGGGVNAPPTDGSVEIPLPVPAATERTQTTYLEQVCGEEDEDTQECKTARCLRPIPAREIPEHTHDLRLASLLVRKKGECQTRVAPEIWSVPVKMKAERECWTLFTSAEDEKVDLIVAGKRLPALEVFDGSQPDSDRLPESHPYSSSSNSLLLHMYPEDMPPGSTLNITALTYGEDPLIAVRAICW